MAGLKKKYTKENLTVIWQPDLCIHSKECFKGLPEVFNPANRPWVNLDAESVDRIKSQVDKCPSGALSYEMKQEEKETDNTVEQTPLIDVSENGPILIGGPANIKYKGNRELKESKTIALCRCGLSSRKPYCDGSHKREGFKG
jgi:uncharacterized Fe-S cluster protein YjdI